MTNLNKDYIKPVNFKSKSPTNPNPRLWYDPKTGKVHMDPVDIREVSLRDFTLIHGFFRRVQTAKVEKMRLDYEAKGGQ
jgi:hypothetical protein